MRKDVLYESVKKFVKTRKEDLNAYFTVSLRIRKFKISCCGRQRADERRGHDEEVASSKEKRIQD